jgi:hypothetical protein
MQKVPVVDVKETSCGYLASRKLLAGISSTWNHIVPLKMVFSELTLLTMAFTQSLFARHIMPLVALAPYHSFNHGVVLKFA